MDNVLVRRSELICPGSSPKMMARATASDADQIIFDLEDGCAVSQKVAARKTVIEALRTLDFGGKLRAYRVNGVTTPYCYRDVIEVVEAAGAFIDVMILPKIDDAADVLYFDHLLTQIETNTGLEIGRIRLEALIESAKGALHAEAIATSTSRLSGLIFGLVDFAGDIGAQEVGAEQFFYYHYAKARVITAARAAGLTAVDGVTLVVRDLQACQRDSEMAARMGFDGKWAIHPTQVPVVNAAFTPTTEQVMRAQKIITAYDHADASRGAGAIVVDDEMVDAATLRVERKRLEIARKAGLL